MNILRRKRFSNVSKSMWSIAKTTNEKKMCLPFVAPYARTRDSNIFSNISNAKIFSKRMLLFCCPPLPAPQQKSDIKFRIRTFCTIKTHRKKRRDAKDSDGVCDFVVRMLGPLFFVHYFRPTRPHKNSLSIQHNFIYCYHLCSNAYCVAFIHSRSLSSFVPD